MSESFDKLPTYPATKIYSMKDFAPPKLEILQPVYGIVAELFLDRHPTEDADFEVVQPKQIENE